MKIAFISDVHGNALALDAVLADIRSRRAEQIVMLGDICYRGPEPARSLELVRREAAQVIKGNADEWVVRGVREGEVPAAALNMMNLEREWTCSRLNGEQLQYLRDLPLQLQFHMEDVRIHAFHATPDSLFDIVAPDADAELLTRTQMSATEADLYIYGHIHQPYVKYVEGKCIVNTGSVGLPFDGMALASYVLVEAEGGRFRVTIERVPYDVEAVAELYAANHYPNEVQMSRIVREGKR